MTFLGDFSFFSALKKLSCCHDNYLKYHVWKIQWFGQHGEGFCMHVFSSTSLKKKKRWIMMGKHILNLYFKFVEEKNSHFVQPREFPCYRRLGRGSMLHSLINPPFCEYKFLLRQDRGTHSISIFLWFNGGHIGMTIIDPLCISDMLQEVIAISERLLLGKFTYFPNKNRLSIPLYQIMIT